MVRAHPRETQNLFLLRFFCFKDCYLSPFWGRLGTFNLNFFWCCSQGEPGQARTTPHLEAIITDLPIMQIGIGICHFPPTVSFSIVSIYVPGSPDSRCSRWASSPTFCFCFQAMVFFRFQITELALICWYFIGPWALSRRQYYYATCKICESWNLSSSSYFSSRCRKLVFIKNYVNSVLER